MRERGNAVAAGGADPAEQQLHEEATGTPTSSNGTRSGMDIQEAIGIFLSFVPPPDQGADAAVALQAYAPFVEAERVISLFLSSLMGVEESGLASEEPNIELEISQAKHLLFSPEFIHALSIVNGAFRQAMSMLHRGQRVISFADRIVELLADYLLGLKPDAGQNERDYDLAVSVSLPWTLKSVTFALTSTLDSLLLKQKERKLKRLSRLLSLLFVLVREDMPAESATRLATATTRLINDAQVVDALPARAQAFLIHLYTAIPPLPTASLAHRPHTNSNAFNIIRRLFEPSTSQDQTPGREREKARIVVLSSVSVMRWVDKERDANPSIAGIVIRRWLDRELQEDDLQAFWLQHTSEEPGAGGTRVDQVATGLQGASLLASLLQNPVEEDQLLPLKIICLAAACNDVGNLAVSAWQSTLRRFRAGDIADPELKLLGLLLVCQKSPPLSLRDLILECLSSTGLHIQEALTSLAEAGEVAEDGARERICDLLLRLHFITIVSRQLQLHDLYDPPPAAARHLRPLLCKFLRQHRSPSPTVHDAPGPEDLLVAASITCVAVLGLHGSSTNAELYDVLVGSQEGHHRLVRDCNLAALSLLILADEHLSHLTIKELVTLWRHFRLEIGTLLRCNERQVTSAWALRLALRATAALLAASAQLQRFASASPLAVTFAESMERFEPLWPTSEVDLMRVLKDLLIGVDAEAVSKEPAEEQGDGHRIRLLDLGSNMPWPLLEL